MTREQPDSYNLSWALSTACFVEMDQARRRWGKVADAMGLGPEETPYQTVFTEPGVSLRHYGQGVVDGPAMLIVPAPIKGPYIWDLDPGSSVVRRCIEHGLNVYLIEWLPPGDDEQSFGLAEYADRLILDCLDTITKETGHSQIVLAGHSLGGTLAAIFAALYPDKVEKLALFGAPLHFGKDVGAIDALVAALPDSELTEATLGNVPGSLLNWISWNASPRTFIRDRWLDWLNCMPDRSAMATHLRVERWSYDEKPLAQRLFEEVVELLYRQDQFMQWRLMVAGKPAAPELIRAPLLNVVDKRCPLVPPRAVLPFHHRVNVPNKKILWYQGDTGVSLQHVGMLVGRHAHQDLWPKVLDWIA